ncbi:hypothetical protein F5Y14DRAFT_403312 [Nemania sp. NC0429]|nr:hypothetical protein F5Y14DRAFT_403312 [Nemania sp. NC0429]
MGTRRSGKFLRCFYCGKRSNVQFEAQKSFDCSNCDATNWLDQNGEITDPPAAADDPEPNNNVQYAIPRPSAYRSPTPLSPPVEDAIDDSIFCATCLRNQQMLRSSLAQFEWPDDITSPEHVARERKYWALRKTLEERYPQVCEDCLPKVNKKLHQASYTAQTDHLRRMMDRTRSQRVGIKKRGPLDIINYLGKLGWYAGFVLQAVWHLTVVSLLLTEPYSSIRDGNRIHVILGSFHRMGSLMLPYPDRIMRWAIHLSMCSFPWNPRFKETIRGFTAHILGFRQWYTYQLLVLLLRFVSLSIAQYSKSHGLPATTQLAPQFVAPLLIIYIYLAAKKSIHTDTTPLFRRPTELTIGQHTRRDRRRSTKDAADLGGILDDILHSSPNQKDQAAQISPPQSTLRSSVIGPDTLGRGNGRSSAMPIAHLINRPAQHRREEPPNTHDTEEMDWSPSASQHRAFNSYNPYRVKNTNPRFSDTPTEPKPGPIWYKVPPAPTNPAQRLRNPPMRPIIRESPKEKKEKFFSLSGRQPVNFGGRTRENSVELSIAPARFYAPESADDPRDGLSSMFATSFTISPSPEGREEQEMRRKSTSDSREPDTAPNRTMTRIVELVALLAASCSWVFALGCGEHYGRSIALASICVCLIASTRLAADLEVDYQVRGDTRPSVFAPCLANLALVQVIAVIMLIWNIWSGNGSLASSGVYGNTVFGSTIIHHAWHILV